MKQPPPREYVANLVAAAAELSELAPAEVMGPSKALAPARARFVVWRVLHERGYGTTAIARAVGYDHATIHSGIWRSRELERLDQDHRLLLEGVRRVSAVLSSDCAPAAAVLVALERAIAAAQDAQRGLERQLAMQRGSK